MILFNVLVLSLAALATADGKAKDKRGIVDYNPPSKYSGSSIYTKSPEEGGAYDKPFRSFQGSVDSVPAYTKSIQALLQKSGPVLPPREYQQYYQQQPQQQVESQAYGAQPAAPAKYATAGAGLDKYAYLTQPQKAQYSSAADVSSFSYSSPVVTYNNHGLLQQIAGKSTTPSHGTPITYSSAASPKVQYQSSPKYQYVSAPAPQQSYSSAYPSAQGLTSSKPSYSAGSNAYSGASNAYSASPSAYSSAQSAYSQPQASSYEDASNTYQQISQKALFTAAPVQEQQQVYQSSPAAAQKFAYVQPPSAYQEQKGSPQLGYSAQQGYSSSSYGADEQNLSQLYLTEQVGAQQQPQQQQQYYSVAPQQKYTKSGVTYA